MKPIFFPGNSRQVCRAEYAILIDNGPGNTLSIPRAHIVIFQGSRHMPGTSILNSSEGRDVMLNQILAQDLAGIRTDLMRFTVLTDFADRIDGLEFPIHVDLADYIARGNPYDTLQASPINMVDAMKGALLTLVGRGSATRQTSVWSYNVVGGCAQFYTVEEEAKSLSRPDAAAIFQALTTGAVETPHAE